MHTYMHPHASKYTHAGDPWQAANPTKQKNLSEEKRSRNKYTDWHDLRPHQRLLTAPDATPATPATPTKLVLPRRLKSHCTDLSLCQVCHNLTRLAAAPHIWRVHCLPRKGQRTVPASAATLHASGCRGRRDLANRCICAKPRCMAAATAAEPLDAHSAASQTCFVSSERLSSRRYCRSSRNVRGCSSSRRSHSPPTRSVATRPHAGPVVP